VLRLGADVVKDVALASRREWLLADGLGGWAASSVLGLNTRGGHGLLVTAATPPYPRLVLLSRVEEAVTCDGVRYELGTNDYGTALHPRGFEHADAFVLSSFAEGIPVVLMEAMAMEIPCIANYIAGIPELLRDGIDGLLVPASDEKGLAGAIARLMDDPELRLRLGRASRTHVLEDYNLPHNILALDAIFRRRVGGGRELQREPAKLNAD